MRRTPLERSLRAGFTLVELLLVMGILALVLGVSMGLFASLDVQSRTVVSEVRGVIRSAANWATARSAPARVRIDVARGAIRAEGLEVIGTWRFEKLPISGAFELDGSNFGALLTEDGFQGNALHFETSQRTFAEIAVQKDASYDFRDGFALEFALRPEPGRGGRVLAFGSSIAVDVTAQGRIKAWFIPERADESGKNTRSGRVGIETEPAAVPAGRWSRVAVRYDRRLLRIFVEGVTKAELAETAKVWPIDGPLRLSNSERGFTGSLDNLVISAVAGEEESLLPEGTRFLKGTPSELVFAPGGTLDRTMHKTPPEVHVQLFDGRQRTVRVSLYGTVE